jgi:polyisoprenyl-phosphate glycosyltransferase
MANPAVTLSSVSNSNGELAALARTSEPAVSVVIPVYRASASLDELFDRLIAVLDRIPGNGEIIAVDDASPDDSWAVLCRLKERHGARLRVARLHRNSGQHNALLCGFSLARGRVVVTMDDDLQNPPEELPKLLAAIEHGYDLVVGAYEEKQHSAARNASGGIVDAVIRRIFSLPSDFQLTSFRAVRRHVIDNVVHMAGVFPYVTTMLFSHTSRYANVTVRHDVRKHGSSNYNLARSLSLAANLIFSYSSLPVMFVGLLCLCAFGFSLAFGSWIALRALLLGTSVPGWTSTIVVLSFFNAISLLCMFIFALYLSRMNQQLSRSRVNFSISELRDDA